MTQGALFDRVVALSGLSEVFAVQAIEGACARANVPAQKITPTSLMQALPNIAHLLRTFLAPEEAQRRIALISSLAETGQESVSEG